MYVCFAKLIYNEYIKTYFFIARCFYYFCQWRPRDIALDFVIMGLFRNDGVLNLQLFLWGETIVTL